MSTEFIWPIRVYYEDTDAGGIVYYANYLKFYERARTEWLNYLQIDQPKLLANDMVFVVTKVEVNYLKPARLNDQLVIRTKLLQVKTASLLFEQSLYLQKQTEHKLTEDVLLNKAKIKVACLTHSQFSPCRMPANVKEEFQRAC